MKSCRCWVNIRAWMTATGSIHSPLSYSVGITVILQQLFKIFDWPQRSDAIMAENQFQGHREESESERVANTCKGKERERERDFSSSLSSFSRRARLLLGVISQATPVSFLLAGQIPVVFRAASDVEPGSIQLVPALT